MYTTQKAEYLVSRGFNVTVITGFPYYPQWEIGKDYKNQIYLVKEIVNGVKVYRSRQYVPRNPTFIKRIVHLISFTFGSLINLFRVSRPDIIISIIPFTTSAFLGWFLKIRYRRSNLWIHIQDFEFDAAIDSGLLNGNKILFIRLLLRIEEFVLKRANVVSTISHGMLNKLKKKTESSTFYLTNWIDTDKFTINRIETHKYLKSSAFKILYSGNIGAKQDWDFFLRVLEELRRLDDIEVIVVGEGAEKKNLLKEISSYGFVKHFNLVPYHELPSLLRSADLHILFQKSDVIDTVMPSKILGMMASSKPSIVTGNIMSEVAKVFEASNGGFYFDGKSVGEVINKIKTLSEDKLLCCELGSNAKSYVQEKFSKEFVLDKFVDELKNMNKD